MIIILHRRRNHLVSNRNENIRRNYLIRNRLSEINISYPNLFNLPNQKNEFERFYEQIEIDSNNNNESEGNNIIDNFCEVKIKNISKLEESNKKCAIYLDKFNSKVKVIILPFVYIFHRSCINNWLE